MWIEILTLGIGWCVLWLWWGALLYGAYYVLSLPLRRQEKTGLFLDLLAESARAGQAPEAYLISLARSGDRSLGKRFAQVAKRLEAGARLEEALIAVPEFLPSRVCALLKVGLDRADLSLLAPVRALYLNDARSQILGAMNYLMVLAFAVGPVACSILGILVVYVLPKYQMILAELEVPPPALLEWLIANSSTLISVLSGLNLLLVLLTVLYLGGPPLSRWLSRNLFPWTDHVAWLLPWKRTRIRRDFTASLATFLDAGMPEPRAVTLAAESCSSNVVSRMGVRMAADLSQGRSLFEALRRWDRSREYEWRLRNAFHGSGGFATALRGWMEALDARAFRQEQVAAQLATTAFVLGFGLIVGVIVVGVFQPLIAVINTAALW